MPAVVFGGVDADLISAFIGKDHQVETDQCFTFQQAVSVAMSLKDFWDTPGQLEIRIASRIRSGDMGSWVSRAPTASAIALAIAAGGARIGASPTPRTP